MLVRGRRGRTRISTYVFLEYLVVLLVLAGLGLFFWIILIRVAVLPFQLDYTTLFPFVVSHFLPGVPTPLLPVSTPTWMHIGPSCYFLVLVRLVHWPSSVAIS